MKSLVSCTKISTRQLILRHRKWLNSERARERWERHLFGHPQSCTVLLTYCSRTQTIRTTSLLCSRRANPNLRSTYVYARAHLILIFIPPPASGSGCRRTLFSRCESYWPKFGSPQSFRARILRHALWRYLDPGWSSARARVKLSLQNNSCTIQYSISSSIVKILINSAEQYFC